MPYSPEDIVAYAFRTRARGYDRDEVDGFLDALADQIEQERTQAAALEERIGALEARLAEADESERALKRTLVTVQDAADRALTEAQQEVAELRAEADREVAELQERTERELTEHRARAEAEAAEVVAAAQAEALAQRERVRELQELDAGHRARLRDHLEEQLAALRELPDPFAELEVEDPGVAGDGDPGGQDPAGQDGDPHDTGGQPDAAEHDPWRLSPSATATQAAGGTDDEPGVGDGDRDGDADGADHPEDAGAAAPEDPDTRDRPDAPMWG